MAELGLLIRRSDQTYAIGPHVLRWSNGFDRQTDVATEFALLCDETSIPDFATASLSVPEEMDMVFIAARQATASNRFTARPGMRIPAALVASGKAFLSLSADFEVRRLIGGMFPTPLTDKSVRGVEELLEELKDGRAEGVCRDIGQCFDGVTNISSPVINALNKPLAAVMLSTPSELAEGAAMDELSHAVVSLANRLSRRMGADVSL
jgi:DNA-binding IclR family transcriptional regulator